jgi:hypothetical protein
LFRSAAFALVLSAASCWVAESTVCAFTAATVRRPASRVIANEKGVDIKQVSRMAEIEMTA